MTKKHKTREAQIVWEPVDIERYRCVENDPGECEAEIRVAIEESVRRFLKTNQDNIRKSRKEMIASASYSGGMVDMIEVVRSALGRWAVGQLLAEIAIQQRVEDQGGMPECRLCVSASAGVAGITTEDAKELGEQIAKWIEGRNGKGKNQTKDPMFV